jgi:peptidoglycan/LPS O-acetylase OafA/YrhL
VEISFEMVCDALATGCLLALARTSLHAWEPYSRLLRSRFVVPLSILLFWIAYRIKATHELLWLVAAIPLANFSSAFLLDHCMTEENIYSKTLNLGWIAHIGVLSYSLYLWQEVFLVQGRWTYQPWHWFPISWVLAFGAASASYYLVERPFLRLRERLRILRPAKGTETSHVPLRALPPAGLDRFAT